jgi:hypothetical protein
MSESQANPPSSCLPLLALAWLEDVPRDVNTALELVGAWAQAAEIPLGKVSSQGE